MTSLYDRFYSSKNKNNLYNILTNLIKKNYNQDISNNNKYINVFNNNLENTFLTTKYTQIEDINKEVLRNVLNNIISDFKDNTPVSNTPVSNTPVSNTPVSNTPVSNTQDMNKKKFNDNNSVMDLYSSAMNNRNYEANIQLNNETPKSETPINQLNNETPINQLNNETPINQLNNETPINQLNNEIPINQLNNETPINQLNNEIPINQLNTKENVLNAKENKLKTQENQLNTKENELNAKENELNAKENELKTQEKKLKMQENELKMQENELNTKENELKTQENKLKMEENELKTQENELNAKENELKTQENKLNTKENELNIKENELNNNNINIVSSLYRIEDQDDLYNFHVINNNNIILNKLDKCIIPMLDNIYFNYPYLILNIEELNINKKLYLNKVNKIKNINYGIYIPENEILINKIYDKLTIKIKDIYNNNITYKDYIEKEVKKDENDNNYIEFTNINDMNKEVYIDNNIYKVDEKIIIKTNKEKVNIINLEKQTLLIFT